MSEAVEADPIPRDRQNKCLTCKKEWLTFRYPDQEIEQDDGTKLSLKAKQYRYMRCSQCAYERWYEDQLALAQEEAFAKRVERLKLTGYTQ